MERVVRGAYKMASSSDSDIETFVAFWKLTRPSAYGFERALSFDGIAVGGHTASFIHGFGVLQPEPCRIYAPNRMRSRLPGVSFAQRKIEERDVMLREGMYVTRPERTILDLVLDREDLSLVADTLHDARVQFETSGGFSMERLRELFDGIREGGMEGRDLLDMLVATGR
ncbi:MAG: hypothetical protein IJ125_08945 [Atopobiaceae bacterium]|nr:hypothetical protein [Atopobiaceae bacterium]